MTVSVPKASCGVRDPVRGIGLRRLHLFLHGEQRKQTGAGSGSGSSDGFLYQLAVAVAGRGFSLRPEVLEVQQT